MRRSASYVAVRIAHDGDQLVVHVDTGGASPSPSVVVDLTDRVGALGGAVETSERRTARGDPVRVVVADDSLLTREGIVRLLGDAGIDVVGQAEDADRLLEQIQEHAPDVAVVDIKMPPTHTDEGLVAAQRIRDNHPDVAVLVLSQYVEPAYAMRLLDTHAERVGYLLKDRVFAASALVEAIRRVHEGESVVDPTIVSSLLGRQRRSDPLAALSRRERDVLALVAEGRSNKAIAARLYVTERTVEAHVTQIFLKLRLDEHPDSHRRVLAVLAFLRA